VNRDGEHFVKEEAMHGEQMWATFSIYDQQSPSIYKPSILLFDKVVMPVPTKPHGTLTQEQLQEMAADAEFLRQHGAGVVFEWNPAEFDAWQRESEEHPGVESEALAFALSQADAPLKTRLQLADAVRKKLSKEQQGPVRAIPVYGSPERVTAVAEVATQDFGLSPQWTTFAVVMKVMCIPDERASLQDLVSLREKPYFQGALNALREWQEEKAYQLVERPDRMNAERLADEFARHLAKYNKAVDDANLEKKWTAVAIMFSVGGALLGAAAGGPPLAAVCGTLGPLVAGRNLMKPAWAAAEGREFELAGVAYHANNM
jgi:hypothetical protein